MRIARAGYPLIAPPLVGAIVAAALGWVAVAVVLLVAAAYVTFFFRDPTRTPPEDPRAIVAPGDGKVMILETAEDGRPFIGIFLGLMDVHVNRSPARGTVARVEHRPGRFIAAFKREAADVNEQNRIRLTTSAGDLDMRQVVGVAARRIECWKEEGDRVNAGDRIGIMKFGSRIDLVLPAGSEVVTRLGARVRAGETVIGRLAGAESAS